MTSTPDLAPAIQARPAAIEACGGLVRSRADRNQRLSRTQMRRAKWQI